jgi:hypothetical protein
MSKRYGSGNWSLVVVGRHEPDDDLVARLDLLAVHLDVARGGAAEVHGDGGPAQHLLDGAVHERRVGADRVAQLGHLVTDGR